MAFRSRLLWIALALGLAGLAAWGIGTIVERRAITTLLRATEADARLRQGLLESEVARFRLLPLALSDDRDVIASLRGAAGGHVLDAKLASLARMTGAAVIYVIGPDGRAIAASNWRTPRSFVGQDYRFRRYYLDARRTGAGEQFALGTVSGRPGLYLSRRTREGGIVVVKLDFTRLERQWAAAGGTTFVTDARGIVLVTSRRAWRFARTRRVAPGLAEATRVDLGVPRLKWLGIGSARGIVLAQAQADPSGWRVNLARPVRPAVAGVVRAARIAAGLAVLALCGIGWSLRDRARRRAERTVALEAAVAERTAELRREIEARDAAEARAADLREGLRQANRLAALGQITASVAHETAQPVAAIRTYAATGEQLLDLDETEAVRGNLRAIGRLTERIGAVTAQLRGFARKGAGAIQPVPLAEVIEGARLILKERLSRVAVAWPEIPAGLAVQAGRTRLEQVVVNLLQNATEALEGVDDPHIAMTLAVTGDDVRLTIADNGPGIAPGIADRLFLPFATSREQGLGLGLAIAHDIMVEFGGTLQLLPGADGGATFEIGLKRA